MEKKKKKKETNGDAEWTKIQIKSHIIIVIKTVQI